MPPQTTGFIPLTIRQQYVRATTRRNWQQCKMLYTKNCHQRERFRLLSCKIYSLLIHGLRHEGIEVTTYVYAFAQLLAK